MLRLGGGQLFCGNISRLYTFGVEGLASKGCALGFLGLDGPSMSLESELEGAGRFD